MTHNRKAIALAVAGLLLGSVPTASAQTSTSGAVRGTVVDRSTGDNVVGATVVASSPALQGTQATITDEGGEYFIANLPPGAYQVVVYYADAQFTRPNVLVQVGKVGVVNIRIDGKAAAGETIVVEGRAPLIDEQSTKTGTTITPDYTRNVPSGRTYGEVLGASAGSQGDLYGTSVGGSTSVENTYIVEGINTTDPGLGLLSTNLPNEFIQETEVITGGYNAEYGRSTGGVINVVTKSGSNEFHGSVFGYWTPGALVADRKPTPRAGDAIDREDNLANEFDVGAEVGGPIVKDRLWFHVGFNPSFVQNDVSRVVKTQVDEDGDGLPDVDDNGFTVLNELDRSNLRENAQRYFYSAKLTGAVTPEHQGSLAVMGSPSQSDDYYAVVGSKSAIFQRLDRNIFDVAGKWTSTFFDAHTQVDAVVGWHGDRVDDVPGDGGGDSQVRYELEHPITDFSSYESSFGGVPDDCVDGGASDPYPMITNCPVPFYRTGGIGYEEDTYSRRLSGALAVTQRVTALGHHVFKGGLDVEQQGYEDSRRFTNGERYRERTSGAWDINRFYTPSDGGAGSVPCGVDIDGDGMPEASCSLIPGDQFLSSDTRTRNLGAFVQDSWSILPNVTLNAGVRWEQQTLFTAEHIQGRISPTTGEPIPEQAFELKNMLAPRVGVVYDWTKEGRSKLYGHYGRFYESIPMDINARAYGGEVFAVQRFDPGACDEFDPVGNCDPAAEQFAVYSGGGEELVAPGIGAQYLDEMVAGSEYEILPDLKIGAAYIRRNLGRAIEDMSTDGSNTYIVANPGEVDEEAIAGLRAEAMAESDPNRAAFLNYEADTFEGVGAFDKPKRIYNAMQLTAERRFTKAFMLQGSYTYSKLQGNYPGLFSPETGQLDPNLTSMYDLPELMANRYGDLAADRPHLFKLDGFYMLPVERIGFFVFGGRARASSGVPVNALGSHPVYGLGESYILPRGESGRTDFTTRFDAHVAYGRDLAAGTRLEAFVDVFNLFNQQPPTGVDENYTYEDVNPIVGGDSAQLAHVKAFGADGLPSSVSPQVNPNYKNANDRQAPLSARFGLRLIF